MAESSGERLSRLLALVPWLLAHDGVSIDEASAHFGVGADLLERDLWLLVVSGLPGYGPDQLVDIDFWDDGQIHVLDPQTLDRPLRLTPDEALVLLISLRMLAQIPGIGNRQAILSASAKIEAAVAEAVPAGTVPMVEVQVRPEVIDVVDGALASGKALRITYAGASRDDITDRVIVPSAVRAVDGLAYLEAWCTSAEADRTFRMDRIMTAELDVSDTKPPDDPSRRLPSLAESSVTALSVTARLVVTPKARWVLDVHAGAVLVQEGSNGDAVVEMPLHSLDWGVRLVLSLCGEATAVEPPELVTAVRQTAESALKTYPDRVG